MKVLFFIFIFFIKKIKINCVPCFEYSCEECETPQYGKCTQCREGFKLISGTCPCSDLNCALCYNGLAGLHLCSLCKKGYYNFNRDCYCDINDCEICSENGCVLCKAGYYYNNITHSCEKQNEEDKIACFDNNCDGCYSSEKGGCEICKEGYFNAKGECEQLPDKISENTCPDGFYLTNNICEKICDGVTCDNKEFYYYRCPSNKCLVCTNNVLQIFSECDNSDICTMEGCLNCITNDECIICSQGYYLLHGICTKCPEGCSFCSDNNTCIHCLSGFELNAEKKCNYTGNFDFNVVKYKKYKNYLIDMFYPEENINDEEYDTVECDEHCLKCYDDNAICKECNKLYILNNNECIKHCSDSNCLECSLVYNNEQCVQCKNNYILKNGICSYNCSDKNCMSCTFEDNVEKCDKCSVGYTLDESFLCKKKTDYLTILFCILGALIFLLIIASFFLYKRKRIQLGRDIFLYNSSNNHSNFVNVYGRNHRIDNSGRMALNKETISEEFEALKRKMEKGKQMCQFCKKKPGKFKCDCGCIVCKEHSVLKKVEGDGENYKICFNCEKVVKKVTQIKYDCHICMQKKISVVHFKCGCSLEVCKDCYIKCKMGNDKCPGCRAVI